MSWKRQIIDQYEMVYPLLPLHCSYWWKTDLSSHVFSVKGLYSLRMNHSCDGEMSQWRNGKERKKSTWEIQYICSRYTTQPRSPVVLISHTNVDISHHLSPSSPMTLHVCLQTVTSSLMGKFPHVMAQISPFFLMVYLFQWAHIWSAALSFAAWWTWAWGWF